MRTNEIVLESTKEIIMERQSLETFKHRPNCWYSPYYWPVVMPIFGSALVSIPSYFICIGGSDYLGLLSIVIFGSLIILRWIYGLRYFSSNIHTITIDSADDTMTFFTASQCCRKGMTHMMNIQDIYAIELHTFTTVSGEGGTWQVSINGRLQVYTHDVFKIYIQSTDGGVKKEPFMFPEFDPKDESLNENFIRDVLTSLQCKLQYGFEWSSATLHGKEIKIIGKYNIEEELLQLDKSELVNIITALK